jgi:hypothetical protein
MMVENLMKVEVAPFDPIKAYYQLGVLNAPVESVVSGLRKYGVGDVETFQVSVQGLGLIPVKFALRYQNQIVDMWVQKGIPVDSADLAKAADTFANIIYPKVRATFGEEWSPGVDDNPRLFILNVITLGANVAGQYVPSDEYPQAIVPYSNQHEMFYMSLRAGGVGSETYLSTLSHEFQHMVQWQVDRNESTWVNEGLSQVSQRINGYNDAFTHNNFLFDSQIQLNSWSDDFRQSYSNYGASYLYLLYIKERFGENAISLISHNPREGMIGVDEALKGNGTTADDVFSDWIVANYLNDPTLADGRYGYQTETLIPICPRSRLAASSSQPPRTYMPQYSAQYIEIEGTGEFTIDFQGKTETRLIKTEPKNGEWFWWSNRGEDSQMTLTRSFDLTGLTKASLEFWTWYDMRQDADFGFVMVSTDNGETWQFVETSGMSPNSDKKDFGPHFTGGSGGGGDHPIWSWEKADLTPYVGQPILLRFAYFPELKANGDGWAIDNLRIPELNYSSDFEQEEDGWVADGFARVSNTVPQKWTVSLVEYENGTTITPLALDGQGAVQHTVTLKKNPGRATLIIGAMAPMTHFNAEYHLQVGGSGKMISLDPEPGVLLKEDFESPCSSFYSFILPDYSQGYKNGEYEFNIKTDNQFLFTTAQQDFTDTIIEADVNMVEPGKDGTVGLICRYQDSSNLYDFSIRSDGTYMIGKFVDGSYEWLLDDWTPSEYLKVGEPASYHLRVACVEDTLSLSVDGHPLATVTDSSFRKGDVGVSAGTFDDPLLLATFDNFIVMRPE